MKRGWYLGILLVLITTITLPAEARTFRTDVEECNPDSLVDIEGRNGKDGSEPINFCWLNVPDQLDQSVELPSDRGSLFDTFGGGGRGAFGFLRQQALSDFFIRFDYPTLLADLGNPTDPEDPDAFSVLGGGLVEYGLARSTSPGTNVFNTSFVIPVIRITWNVDDRILQFADGIFHEDREAPGESVGVRLIFYGDGSQPIVDRIVNGAAFEILGLRNAGFRYVSTSVWDGSKEPPCDRFDIAGNPLCTSSVPEPSSFALFGIGLIASVLGWRSRRLRVRPI